MDSAGIRTPEPDDIDLEFTAIVANIDLLAATPASCLGPAQEPAAPTEAPAPSPPPPPERTWEPPPKPPELVVPPKPDRPQTGGVVNWWAKAFPHIVWLSVFAGLSGQVFGFAEFFGGTKLAWVIALALGGTFEFMMVACSSRGLRAIGLDRGWSEYLPFLILGTAAAGFAAYMNLNHFDGWLGLAAATVSMLGYTAHVTAHLFDELEHRTALKEWEDQKDEIEAEIKARADAERAEYDHYRSQLAKQRSRDLTTPPEPTSAPKATTSPAAKATPKTTTGRPTSNAGGKISKADAIRIGIDQGAHTPAKLKAAIKADGYKLPASPSTIENWCKDIKAQLGLAQQNRP